MTVIAFNPKTLGPAWNTFQRALPVRMAAIRNQADHDRAVAFMNQLLDVVGDDEEHELADMLELMGKLIQDYESQHFALPNAQPAQVLRFLMDQHGLKQTDLASELGTQSVVSEVLSGRRHVNLRQAKALAGRFGVSVAAFI